MDDKTLIILAYIINAPTREIVLRAFKDEDFLRPIQISKKTNLHPNNVSKNLKDFRENNIVYVINPEYHVPKLYRLTEYGKNILKLIDEEIDRKNFI